MNAVITAAALGAVSGSRSMLAPALVARAVGDLPFAPLLSVLATGELVADKLPGIPARTDALPLTARLLSGAIVGALVPSLMPASAGRKPGRVVCALAGATGALAAAYALVALRRLAAAQRIPNGIAGACEDVMAIGAGLLLLPDATPPRGGAAGGVAFDAG